MSGWNGSGDFERIHNFSADASAGIKILASRQDAEWANFETGLENCITRDGQNSPIADLPMGGQKHTNVGAAASVTQYLRVDQFIRQIPIYCSFGGTAEAMSASAVFAITSLTAGVQVLLSCPSVNTTTSVTLGLGGAGTATVRRADGKGPARGQVKGLHRYVHDGANWILTDPSPPVGRIMVIGGTGSAPSNTEVRVSGFSQLTAEGFALSSDVIQVPGGIRAVRIVAQVGIAPLVGSFKSASGSYRIAVYTGPNGTLVPGWGGGFGSDAYVQNFQASVSSYETRTIVLDYVSVKEGYKIAVAYTPQANVTTPTSAQCNHFYVAAID